MKPVQQLKVGGIGILMCVLFVNVFTAVEELLEVLKQQRADLGRLFLVALCNFFSE